MKRITITTILIFMALLAGAQVGLDLSKYTFAKLPSLTPEEEQLYNKDDAVGLYFSRAYEYRPNQDGNVELYKMYHYAFKVYKKEFLEAINVFEMNVSNQQDVVNCGGKRIAPDGTTELLSKKDLEEKIEDEDTTLLFKFPYANTGDIIEFFYVTKANSISTSGYWIFPASEVTVKECYFTIASPKYLDFYLIGYNGLPAKTDTVIDDKTRFNVVMAKNLPKVPEEPMSFTSTYLPRVEFLLSNNYSQSQQKFNTIDAFDSRLYSMFHNLDKDELKALKKINASIKVNKKLPPLEQAKQIENYIKTHFSFYPYNMATLSNLSFIAELKAVNDFGCAKLMYNLFLLHNVKADIVMTTDKTEQKFDKKNNFTNLLDEIMLYLPDYDQYTAGYFPSRFGYPTAALCGNDGYIFKKAELKSGATFYHEPHKTPVIEAEKSVDEITANISLDLDENLIRTQLTRKLTGYTAPFHTRLVYTAEEDYESEGINRYFDAYLGLGVESINVKNITVENKNAEDILVNPLLLSAELEDYHDLKNGGDTLSFTIGNYIGKQSPIEVSENRILPVERSYKMIYKRTLKVNIPEGYKCMNLKDLETVIYDTGNEHTAQALFKIKTEQQDNRITIYCEELYNRDFYPAIESKGVLRIANAAFEFNKAKLLFVK
jgi:hypothetical protein